MHGGWWRDQQQRVQRRCFIGLIQLLGFDVFICVFIPFQIEGGRGHTMLVAAHSVGCGCRCEKGKLVKIVRNTASVCARVSKTKSRENTVRLLCSLALSMLCLVFLLQVS